MAIAFPTVSVILELVLIIIAAVILFTFVFVLGTSVGAQSFGIKCYFDFLAYSVINNPAFSLLYSFGSTLNLVPPAGFGATSLQSACIQTSNINAYSTTDIANQLYTKASSCFNLFQGNDYSTGISLLSSNELNNVFTCYVGRIYNYETSNLTTFAYGINYIDQNYYSPQNPLQIVFITNGSSAQTPRPAAYPDLNQIVYNNSNYQVAYFGYPYNKPPTGCYVPFVQRCQFVSQYGQPSVPDSSCSFGNSTVSQAYEPVSSLTNGEFALGGSSTNPQQVCQNAYFVSFCGYLINAMTVGQDRVFVCVTNSTVSTASGYVVSSAKEWFHNCSPRALCPYTYANGTLLYNGVPASGQTISISFPNSGSYQKQVVTATTNSNGYFCSSVSGEYPNETTNSPAGSLTVQSSGNNLATC